MSSVSLDESFALWTTGSTVTTHIQFIHFNLEYFPLRPHIPFDVVDLSRFFTQPYFVNFDSNGTIQTTPPFSGLLSTLPSRTKQSERLVLHFICFGSVHPDQWRPAIHVEMSVCVVVVEEAAMQAQKICRSYYGSDGIKRNLGTRPQYYSCLLKAL